MESHNHFHDLLRFCQLSSLFTQKGVPWMYFHLHEKTLITL